MRSQVLLQNKTLPDYITINTDSLPTQDSFIHVQKLRSFFIPAIIYWQNEHTLKCELSPKALAKKLEEEIILFADSVDLRSKLKGQKLELSILQLPYRFIYTNKEKALFFLVAYAVSTLEAIYPGMEGLKIRYRVLDNEQLKKEGILSIPYMGNPLKNTLKSTKKFTWYYLDEYQYEYAQMKEQFFEKLVDELTDY